MICTKCEQEGELKVFDTFEYYYCHSCKDEIKLAEVESYWTDGADADLEDLQDLEEPWAQVLADVGCIYFDRGT